MRVIFAYLTAFSRHGGIEKFNKCFIKALADQPQSLIWGLYDTVPDISYVSQQHFVGYKGHKSRFIFSTLKAALSQDVLILGHINLAVLILAKLLKPSLKVVIVAHGIEVWFHPLSILQKFAIKQADKLLAVSNYTKGRLQELYDIPAEKIVVFPNTLDPCFQLPLSFKKRRDLCEKYSLNPQDKILVSVCRLAAVEGYKGYDTVLSVLPEVKKQHPDVVYLVVGKYDESEKARLEVLANSLGVSESLRLTGYVEDEDLTDHFLLGDVYVMPSRHEGFGIVFIEALACGIPVIAGNKDGSVDALANGALGTLVDPYDKAALANAIAEVLSDASSFDFSQKKVLQDKVIARFGFDGYRQRLNDFLFSLQ